MDPGGAAVSPEEAEAYVAAQAAQDTPASPPPKRPRIVSPPSERPRREGRRTPEEAAAAARADAAARYDMSPAGIKSAQTPAAKALLELAEPPPPGKSLLESLMEYTSVSLLQQVWGKENLDAWQEKYKKETQDSKDAIEEAKKKGSPIPLQKFRYPPARDLLELLSPAQKQCLAIIGEVKKDQPCYICGFPIGELAIKNGLSPECEHILPVAQAVLLYDLYQPNDLEKRPPLLPKGASPRDPVKEKAFFVNEYRWAHNVCNQVKSDDNIIAYKEGTGFYLDIAKLTELLTKIYNEKRLGGPDVNKLVNTNGGFIAWRDRRLLAVSNEVKELVNFLNTQLLGGGDRMMALVAAANLISRVKVDFQNIPPVEVESAGERFKEHAAKYGDDFLALYRAAEEEAAPAPAPAGPLAGQKRKRGGGKRRKTYRMRRCRLPKLL